VDRGRQVFRKSCAACHRLEDHGHAVGPDLLMTTDKPADWFLTAILRPEPGSRGPICRVPGADRRTAARCPVCRAAETGVGITLRGAEGKEQTIRRRDLESLATTGRSPMPDGMEKELPPAVMADLLAYITSLRPIRPPDRR